MKLVVLGSAAAEAIPNPFCRCEVCEDARRGGHGRGRSAVLINDDLLVDLGPDVVSAATRFNLYLGNLETVLITHRHEDHWLPSNLVWREPGFAPTGTRPLTLYGPGDLLPGLEPYLDRLTNFSLQPVEPGEQWLPGPYRVTAIPATHARGQLVALLYVIDDGTHRVFYATDTSSLSERAWDLLRPLGPMDLILLDATCGLGSGGTGHHGFEQFIDTRQRMLDEGLVASKTTLVAHHFSHNGGLTREALVEKFNPYGVRIAYDGCTFEL